MVTHSNILDWKISRREESGGLQSTWSQRVGHDQSWVFIGRTDEAETPILWPPDEKSWLIWKNPDAGEAWRREEKGMTEDETVGWHYWLNEHEFGSWWWTGRPVCYSSWGRKKSDTTEQLNWTELNTQVWWEAWVDANVSVLQKEGQSKTQISELECKEEKKKKAKSQKWCVNQDTSPRTEHLI